MKVMNLVIFLVFLAWEQYAQAIEFKVTGGIRSQSANVGPGIDRLQNESFHLGLLLPLYVNGSFGLSCGLLYTQRNLNYKVVDSSLFPPPISHDSGSFEFSYLDIPLRLEYSLNSNILIWAGPVLGFNINSKCKTNNANVDCALIDTKKIILPVAMGIDFTFLNSMGVGFFYEATSDNSSGDLAQNIKSYAAVGANIFYKF